MKTVCITLLIPIDYWYYLIFYHHGSRLTDVRLKFYLLTYLLTYLDIENNKFISCAGLTSLRSVSGVTAREQSIEKHR